MIFVTVGTQIGFDRLIRALDGIAESVPNKTITAQIGNGKYKPKNFSSFSFCSPGDLHEYLKTAELIIAHAGMGTILKCLEFGSKLIVMPRLKQYGEHRNDHQIATARCFEKLSMVKVAYSEETLQELLLAHDAMADFIVPKTIEAGASQSFLQDLSKLIENNG